MKFRENSLGSDADEGAGHSSTGGQSRVASMPRLAAAAVSTVVAVVAVGLVAFAVQGHGPAAGTRAAALLAAAHQDTLQYVYMPAAAAKDTKARSAMLNALLTQSLDDELGDGLGNNKSCAISSLVAQANFIFPHWYAFRLLLTAARSCAQHAPTSAARALRALPALAGL